MGVMGLHGQKEGQGEFCMKENCTILNEKSVWIQPINLFYGNLAGRALV